MRKWILLAGLSVVARCAGGSDGSHVTAEEQAELTTKEFVFADELCPVLARGSAVNAAQRH